MDRYGIESEREFHGKRSTDEYHIWGGMIQRCHNSNHRDFHQYGGRGITVCDRWRSSFQAFYEDMGPRPSPEHSLDRRENDLGYSKGNCRWATAQQQAENRSSTRWIEYQGERITATELARISGNNVSTILNRLNRGDSPEEIALSTSEAIRSSSQMFAFNGESLTLLEWAEKTGVTYTTLYSRIHKLGWNITKTISTPARPKRPNSKTTLPQ